MSFKNIISEKVILPLSDLILGQSVSKHLKFLMKSQWWTKDQLEDFQNKRLRMLINHAYSTVPYYTDMLNKLGLKPKDIETKHDLKKLPILTKAIIKKEGINRFTSTQYPKKQIRSSSSSGSTGEPLFYLTTKEAYSVNIAANLRGWYWMGYRLGDKFQKISNTERSTIKQIQDILTRNKCVFFDGENNLSIKNTVEQIIKYKPKILRAYPTPLSLILKYVKDNKVEMPKLNAVTTTGSVLHKELRDEIKDVFQCEVFDSYSCEGGAVVFECHTHDCYHIAMEYAITELVADNDETKQDIRKVVTTDLWNYATPFIRYDTQDYVETTDLECKCGREHQKVTKIIGRDADILKSPSGIYLTPHLISIFFKGIDGIDKFQVRQNESDSLDIFIVAKDLDRDKLTKEITSKWGKRFGYEFSLNIEIVDQIPLFGIGKHRYILRSPKIKL